MELVESIVRGVYEAAKDGENFTDHKFFKDTIGNWSWSDAEDRFSEAYGTGFFTNVCRDAANLRLTQAFETFSDDWKKVSRIVTGLDYKVQYCTGFSGNVTLPEKPEYDGFEEANYTDAYEKYTPAQYGRIFSITRQAKVNDQMGAFLRWSEAEGRAAAMSLDKLVFGTIISGSAGVGMTLADSTALFTTAKGNHDTGKGALSEADLSDMIALLLAQTGLKGEKINLKPKYIIVECGNLQIAMKLVTDHFQRWGGTAAVDIGSPNIYGRGGFNLEVIHSENVLDGHYYLAADPRTAPLVEVGFVDGPTPRLTQEATGTGFAFTHDMYRFRVDISYGGTALDYRGFVHFAE